MRHETTPVARDRLTHQKRLLLSRSADIAFQRLVDRIARGLGTPLKSSHVLRACIMLLHNAEPLIIQNARSAALRVPPNGQATQVADFEKQLAHLLLEAFRKVPRT